MAANMQQLAQPDAAERITDAIRSILGAAVGTIHLAA